MGTKEFGNCLIFITDHQRQKIKCYIQSNSKFHLQTLKGRRAYCKKQFLYWKTRLCDQIEASDLPTPPFYPNNSVSTFYYTEYFLITVSSV